MTDIFSKIVSRLKSGAHAKLDWRQEPNRREKMIFFVAMFVFFLVFLRSCWGPSSKAIFDLRSEVELAKEQSVYLKQVLSAKSEGEQDMLATHAAKYTLYSSWAQRLATDPDTVLMTDISNPGILRDIKMGNIDFSEQAAPGGIIKKSFKFSLMGSYSSIGNYLVRMEDLPLLLRVDKIAIKGTDAPGSDIGQKVTVDMEGVVYGWK